MKTIYKVDDGTEFKDITQAKLYEDLARQEIEVIHKKKVKFIPESELGKIFNIGSISSLCFYLKEENGDITEDGGYETNMIDDTGHLDCTDLNHGLLEWSEEDQTYYRIVYGHSWKVELLGISKVNYF